MKLKLFCIFALIINLCACTQTKKDLSLGSANTPEGKTLVVSVFVDDNDYSWNFETKQDQETKENYLDYMDIATEYLIDVSKEYGKESSYIFDFNTNEDLYYEASFKTNLTQDDSASAESCMNKFLDKNVDSDALRNKYEADNIIYFMVLNTDYDSKAITCTRNYYEGMEHPYEIVFLYNIDSGSVNCPAVYAHEMLHTFGAPDLYAEDTDGFGITKDFMDYVEENMPNDLMYTCSDLTSGDYVYDRITNEVSELDAYYAGLTDTCDLVSQFHLEQSQHIQ